MPRHVLHGIALAVSIVTLADAADWPQFRGPGSAGVSGAKGLPLTWSATENILWKRPLPGFGASSAIIDGSKVLVTCYTGYGLDAESPGDQKSLELRLLCFALADGSKLWSGAVTPELPDEPYQSWLPEHGYASGTPASDGKAVYCFFGRSGVHAFDLDDGKPRWKASAGSGTHGFGTAASPLLFEDLVIVNACVESNTLIAFDRHSGEEVWRAPGLVRAWSTPALVTAPGGREEIVVNTEGAVIAHDPHTGEELWRCDGIDDYVCPTVISQRGVVYAVGGRKTVRALAVRAGGSGDVTATRRLWTSRDGSKVPSPVYSDGHLYWVDHSGIGYCMNAASGEVVYKKRLKGIGPRTKTYASGVLADGRLYYVTCHGGTVVLAAGTEFAQLAHNDLGDNSVFNASPAVADGKLILRSDRFLYCIGSKSKS